MRPKQEGSEAGKPPVVALSSLGVFVGSACSGANNREANDPAEGFTGARRIFDWREGV